MEDEPPGAHGPVSVSEALDRLSELNGQIVILVGALVMGFENQCIRDIEKPDGCQSNTRRGSSSIWVDIDSSRIDRHDGFPYQFARRDVQLTGRLFAPSSPNGGCGHFGLWPARIVVTSIEEHISPSDEGQASPPDEKPDERSIHKARQLDLQLEDD